MKEATVSLLPKQITTESPGTIFKPSLWAAPTSTVSSKSKGVFLGCGDQPQLFKQLCYVNLSINASDSLRSLFP